MVKLTPLTQKEVDTIADMFPHLWDQQSEDIHSMDETRWAINYKILVKKIKKEKEI